MLKQPSQAPFEPLHVSSLHFVTWKTLLVAIVTARLSLSVFLPQNLPQLSDSPDCSRLTL